MHRRPLLGKLCSRFSSHEVGFATTVVQLSFSSSKRYGEKQRLTTVRIASYWAIAAKTGMSIVDIPISLAFQRSACKRLIALMIGSIGGPCGGKLALD